MTHRLYGWVLIDEEGGVVSGLWYECLSVCVCVQCGLVEMGLVPGRLREARRWFIQQFIMIFIRLGVRLFGLGQMVARLGNTSKCGDGGWDWDEWGWIMDDG